MNGSKNLLHAIQRDVLKREHAFLTLFRPEPSLLKYPTDHWERNFSD
jgi:hypothetical protein